MQARAVPAVSTRIAGLVDLFRSPFHDCDGQSLPTLYNPVDRHQVPLPHFGIILEPDAFARFAKRLEGQVTFIIKPTTRFEGTVGEQRPLYF